MVARRLRIGARYRRAGCRTLHGTYDKDDRNQNDRHAGKLHHSCLRITPSLVRRISPFAGFHRRRVAAIVYARLQMNPTREHMEGTFERTLTVTGRVSLDVSVHSGVIRVVSGEAGSVRIRGVVRAKSSVFMGLFVGGPPGERIRTIESNPPIAQDGNTIGVGDVTDRWLLRGINLLLEITTPADTEIRALADSGDIRIEGIDGPVECETDSGEINIASIGSEVRVSCDSGGIHIRGVKGAVDARTDSGHIEALEIAGTIDAKTDSGDIRLSQTIVAPVCAQTDSGRIRVQLADTGGYSIRARTDNGRIDLPVLTRQRLSRHEVEGEIRGGGSVVDLETDSGDIDVVAN